MIGVRKQVELKIKLERLFKPEVTRIFNSILRDFRATVAAKGTPPPIAGYKAVWEAALKQHYFRVQKAFTGAVKQAPIDDTVFSVYLDWRNKFAPEQADYINRTTQDNMNEAIQAAINAAAEEMAILETRALSANASAILRRKLRRRVDMIINTETQKAAEAAKFMEVEVISGVKPRVTGGGAQQTDTTKKWTTVGDKFVRPLHRQANGQVRGLYEPYVVGGEFLMHPGDSSLGASIGNLANCRCVSTYRFY